MIDNLSQDDRRRTMQAVKGKGTRLERRMFSMLAGLKIRGWKKNVTNIPGKPDIAFPRQRIAIFIDGCFWHGCPLCMRKVPETNRQYWERKIERNVARSKVNDKRLKHSGYIVIRIWEHEIQKAFCLAETRAKILKALGKEKKGGRKRN